MSLCTEHLGSTYYEKVDFTGLCQFYTCTASDRFDSRYLTAFDVLSINACIPFVPIEQLVSLHSCIVTSLSLFSQPQFPTPALTMQHLSQVKRLPEPQHAVPLEHPVHRVRYAVEATSRRLGLVRIRRHVRDEHQARDFDCLAEGGDECQ